jgi:hypothetical protein
MGCDIWIGEYLSGNESLQMPNAIDMLICSVLHHWIEEG